MSCCWLQTLLMPAILASPFVYDLWKIRETILTSNSYVPLIHLFVDGKILIASFQSLTYYSNPSLSLLQTVNPSLSNTILSGNLYNLHTLSQNNFTNSFANISSIVATKYIILDNLSQTTRIASFLATNSNFIINSTIRCVYGFSGISLNFNFSTGISVQFFILWHIPHPSTYHQ